jgi:hypothetical protein
MSKGHVDTKLLLHKCGTQVTLIVPAKRALLAMAITLLPTTKVLKVQTAVLATAQVMLAVVPAVEVAIVMAVVRMAHVMVVVLV